MVMRRMLPASFGEAFLWAAAFLGSYVLVQLSGVLTAERPGIMMVLHQAPSLAACGMLVVISAVQWLRLAAGTRTAEAPRLPALLFYGGVMLLAAGVLVSSQVRFEGKVVITEGQGFGGDASEYMEGSVYQRRFARYPDVVMVMKAVSPRFLGKGKALFGIDAEALVGNRGTGPVKPVALRSYLPALADGLLVRVKSFGYSPLYRIVNTEGRVFDEAFVMLKLFPQGSEDYFRTIELPYTFYVKYYPDGLPPQEAGSRGGARTGPLFKVRVSRNLDLMVADQPLELYQKLDLGPVPPLFLSFEAVRRWAEISLVRDYGLFLMMPGFLLLLAGVAAALYGRHGISSMFRAGGGGGDA